MSDFRFQTTNAPPFRLAVLASGRGSNLRALIAAQQAGILNVDFSGIFSDNADCGAMLLAQSHGLTNVSLKVKNYASRAAFDEALFSQIDLVQPDLIVCAGYMRLISAHAVQRYLTRMINIHPSLLPKYPGLNTHARALAAGDTEHGASVHWVTQDLDAGPVLAQARVPVLANDTPESLAERVLTREHPLLVQCVKAISEGIATCAVNGVAWRGNHLASPLSLNEHDQLVELN